MHVIIIIFFQFHPSNAIWGYFGGYFVWVRVRVRVSSMVVKNMVMWDMICMHYFIYFLFRPSDVIRWYFGWCWG